MIPLLESPTAQRLAWTLLHFLWQGTLLGLAAWGAFTLLRHQRAQLRYLAGCAFLLACLGSAITTFGVLTPQPTRTLPANLAPPLPSPALQAEAPPAPAFTSQETPLAWQARLRPCLPWIPAAWALGVLVLSGRALGGWLWLRRLRLGASPAPEPHWLGRLVRGSGLRRMVRFLESARVATPLCMGLLRPVVLLPLGFFANLDPLAAEAVLAHELAHLRRLDGLVNGLQCAIEVLLFFHPAVWWLSRRIRTEREHCCDDAAVLACGDALLYAEALSRLDELRDLSPSLALGARGGNLMERLRRLLLADPPRPRFSMPSLAPLVAVALAAALPAQAGKHRPAPPLAGEVPATEAPAAAPFRTAGLPSPLPAPRAFPAMAAQSPQAPELPGAPGPVATPPASPAPQAPPAKAPQPPDPIQVPEPPAQAQGGITYTKTQGGLPVLNGLRLPTTRGPGMGAALLPPYTAIIEDEVPEHRVNWYAALVPPKTTVRIQARSETGGAYLRLNPVGWALSARQPSRGYPECTFTNGGSSDTSVAFYLAFDSNYPGPRRIAIHQTFAGPDPGSPAEPPSVSGATPPPGGDLSPEEARQFIQAFVQLRPWGDTYAQTVVSVKVQRRERWNSAYTNHWPKGPESKALLQPIRHLEGWVVSFQLLTAENATQTFLVLLDRDGVIHWRTPWKKLPPGLNAFGAPTPL